MNPISNSSRGKKILIYEKMEKVTKAPTLVQSQSSFGFVLIALVACTWTQHCMWLCFLSVLFGECDGYLSKPALSQLFCVMCAWMFIHICTRYCMLLCLRVVSQDLTPPEDMTSISQINLSILFQLKFWISLRLKALSASKDIHIIQEAYIMQRGLKWMLFIIQSRRQWAYSPHERLFRL